MDVVSLARLQLGLRHRPCHPHGGAHHGRSEVIMPRYFDPERLSVVEKLLRAADMPIAHRHDRRRKRSEDRPARPRRSEDEGVVATRGRLFRERRPISGLFETNAAAIARWRAGRRRDDRRRRSVVARHCAAPADFGADIVVGSTQPLGVHMNCGGGVGGFIASRDEARYVREYPRLPGQHHRNARRRVRLRPGACIRPPTACAKKARTGPATPSISGPSPTPSICRCWGRKVSASSAKH